MMVYTGCLSSRKNSLRFWTQFHWNCPKSCKIQKYMVVCSFWKIFYQSFLEFGASETSANDIWQYWNNTFRMTVADIVPHLREEQDFSVFYELGQFLSCQGENVSESSNRIPEYPLRGSLKIVSVRNSFHQYPFLTDAFSNSGSGFLAANKLSCMTD